MNWIFDGESWWCHSRAKEGLRWRIVVTMDGRFSASVSDHGLTNRDEPFGTLQIAKSYCESSENAYLAFEVDNLKELRSKLVEEYEHAKACEESMTLGTVGVVAAFGNGMREVLLSSQQREAVKSLVCQMFKGVAVPLSYEELPLEARFKHG